MRYEGRIFRPPSEARSYILQATIGCSHNLCTYCDMYRDKAFRERELAEVLEDIRHAARVHPTANKVFVADGDALVMDSPRWHTDSGIPAGRASRVSAGCPATPRPRTFWRKADEELQALREAGLSLLYIGPESGDAGNPRNASSRETPSRITPRQRERPTPPE